jgi:hypothetical protein
MENRVILILIGIKTPDFQPEVSSISGQLTQPLIVSQEKVFNTLKPKLV